MKHILLILLVATIAFVSCSKDEGFLGRTVKVDGGDYIMNMPTLTIDYATSKLEFTKYFKDVKLDEKEDCIVITASNPFSQSALFESIICTYHLSDGKYESLNLAVDYSIESLNEQSVKDVQQILREQTTILL
ncbi:hypothetical protein EO244_11625 [Ancylomarina salipaludis]|uniref:Uncharacterized protein n=1 Tax=Ancylomarina salipaludis TaxID=2501299 RepID=A0A4Q1JK19_9BACT|nr:hypothetical protein [Ancylomarina salipaludis]RXQ92192.1 hypothetical protein EO244_11625 [Ancylomarina salipaludis]